MLTRCLSLSLSLSPAEASPPTIPPKGLLPWKLTRKSFLHSIVVQSGLWLESLYLSSPCVPFVFLSFFLLVSFSRTRLKNRFLRKKCCFLSDEWSHGRLWYNVSLGYDLMCCV